MVYSVAPWLGPDGFPVKYEHPDILALPHVSESLAGRIEGGRAPAPVTGRNPPQENRVRKTEHESKHLLTKW